MIKLLKKIIKKIARKFGFCRVGELENAKKQSEKLKKELASQKKKCDNLQKTIAKIQTKNSEKLRNIKRIDEHNVANPIWHKMMNGQSVCRTLEYSQYFSRKTWADYDKAAKGRTVILIGNKKDCANYYDRYNAGDVVELNPEVEYWSSMQDVLEEYGFDKIVVLIFGQAWERYAECLKLCGMDFEYVFVYSLIEYEKNENEQLKITWDNFKDSLLDKKVILVTANERAKEFINLFKEEFNIVGIVSAKKAEIGTDFCGYKVGAVEKVKTLYPLDTVFLLCSVNWNDYFNKFRGQGFNSIYSLRLLVRGNPESSYSLNWKTVMGVWRMNPIDRVARNSELKTLFSLLSDEESKVTVENILNFRETRMDDNRFIVEELSGLDPDYFNRPFLPIGTEETYLDIGPEDGGTISDFISRVGNRYTKICAWEIGAESLDILNKKFNDERIEILPYGAWNEDTSMGLQGSEGNRHLTGMGGGIICKRIDDVANYPVTLIKMDIEGAEMNALLGAQETIKKYRPKLIISLYHKPNDIWELPLFVHSLVPKYKLYIRHHRFTANDTVLYAFV